MFVQDEEDNELIAVRTDGNGDCSFHAVRGDWDESRQMYICKDVGQQREILANLCRRSKRGETLYQHVRMEIQNLICDKNIALEGQRLIAARERYDNSARDLDRNIEECWQGLCELFTEEVKELISYYAPGKDIKIMFTNCCNENKEALEELIAKSSDLSQKYQEYNDATKNGHKWNKILKPYKFIRREYLRERIKKRGALLSEPEIRMMAYAYNIKIYFFTKEIESLEKPTTDTFNKEGKTKINIEYIYSKDNKLEGHYQRLIPKSEYNKLFAKDKIQSDKVSENNSSVRIEKITRIPTQAISFISLGKVNKKISFEDAIIQSDITAIEWHLRKKKRTDNDSFRLHQALSESTIQVVELLASHEYSQLHHKLAIKSIIFNHQNKPDQRRKLLWLKENYNILNNNNSVFLHCALGDLDALKKALETNAHLLNSRLYEGYHLIHIAAATNNIAVISWLIEEKKIDYKIEVSRENYLTANDIAAGYGYLNIVTYLTNMSLEDNVPLVTLNYGTFNDMGATNKNNPLHHATKYGQLEVIKYLVPLYTKTGVPICIVQSEKGTVLNIAAKHNHLPALEYLVDIFLSHNLPLIIEDWDIILHSALMMNQKNKLTPYNSRVKLVEYLINLFKQQKLSLEMTDYDGNNLLHHAIKTIDIDSIKLVVESYLTNKIDIASKNNSKQSPFHLAVFSRDFLSSRATLQKVYYLINIYLRQNLRLELYAESGHPLLEAILDKEQNYEVIKLLVKGYIQANVKYDYQRLLNTSSLFGAKYAIRRSNAFESSYSEAEGKYDVLSPQTIKTFQWLLCYTDIDAQYIKKDNLAPILRHWLDNEYPFFNAVRTKSNWPDLEKKITTYLKLEDGTSIMAFAIKHRQVSLIKLWIKAGASIFPIDANKNNLLHYAVYYNVPELVELFSTYPDLINKKNSKGETPLVMALQKKFYHLLKYFQIDFKSSLYLIKKANFLRVAKDISNPVSIVNQDIINYFIEELNLETWDLDDLLENFFICLTIALQQNQNLSTMLDNIKQSSEANFNPTLRDTIDECYVTYFIKPLDRALRESAGWLSLLTKLKQLPLEDTISKNEHIFELDILDDFMEDSKEAEIYNFKIFMESVLNYFSAAIDKATYQWGLILQNTKSFGKQKMSKETLVAGGLELNNSAFFEAVNTSILTEAAAAKTKTVEKIVKPFPVDAIALLLKKAKNFQIEELLTQLHEDRKDQSSFVGNFIAQKVVAGYVPEPIEAMVSKIEIADITKIVGHLYSQSNIYVFQLAYQYFSGEKIDWLEKIGLSEAMSAVATINEFLEPFYHEVNSNKELQHEKLCIHLLRDENFGNFIQDKEYGEIRQILSGLAKQLKIPGLDLTDIFDILTTLYRQVNDIPKEARDKIDSYQLLCLHLLNNNPQSLLQQVIELLPKFSILIKAFIQPQIMSTAQLLQPYVQEGMEHAILTTQQEQVDFYNFLKSYIPFHYLGMFILSPTGEALKSKNLSGFEFKPEETSAVSDKCCITGHFNHFYLKDFSFAHCLFNNFSFADAELLDCDFTGAVFYGDINFSNALISHKTASTLMKAIYLSMLAKDTPCKIIGKMRFNGELNINLEPIQIDRIIKNHVISEVNWCHGIGSAAENSVQTTTEPEAIDAEVKAVVPSETSISEPAQSFWQSAMGYFSSYLPSTESLNFVGQTVVNTLYDMSANTLTATAETLTTDPTTLSLEQEQFNQEMKEVTTSFTASIKSLKQKINQLKLVSQTQTDTTDKLAKDLRAYKKLMQQQQDWLKLYNESLPQMHTYWEEKQAIAKEQQDLLHHPDPSIRIFYKILLTELSGSFLTLFLLQNSLGLIQRTSHKLYAIDNSVGQTTATEPMPKGCFNKAKWILEQKFKKDFFNSCKRGFGNLTLISAKIISPAGSFVSAIVSEIPMGGKIAGAVISGASSAIGKTASQYIDFRENQKLKAMRDELSGLTPSKLEKLAEVFARTITQSYAMPISIIKEESAKRLAQKAALQVIIALLAEGFSSLEESEGIDAITAVQLNLRSFYGIKTYADIAIDFKFLQKKLKFKDPQTHTKATVRDIFQQTGICYFSSKRNETVYFSNNSHKKQLMATKAALLGYMKVEEKNYSHFVKGLVYDSEGNEISNKLTIGYNEKPTENPSKNDSPLKPPRTTKDKPLHTDIRADERDSLKGEKNDRYENLVTTIFGTKRFTSSKNRLRECIQGTRIDLEKFDSTIEAKNLIISHKSIDKLTELRDHIFKACGRTSFKKAIICDNYLILTFYLNEHRDKFSEMLNGLKLISAPPKTNVKKHA
jgi:ankyrin repeat protein